MEDSDFRSLRQSLADIIRQNKETCRKGYADLVYSKDMDDIVKVIRFYWADLNRLLWEQFQECLQKHYSKVEKELTERGIYYNVPCDNGLCCVDEHCPTDCLVIKGTADAVVHAQAEILLLDQARATLLDTSRATACGSSQVDARMWSRVKARDNARVRAFDRSHVHSDGLTDIYMYGNSILVRRKVKHLEMGISARVEEDTTKE